ncbi:uncharacterized protein isoform X2 [Leptinotarsa decemlineata]|uniref:uncharacterized protein isoform X2 n=1 Tax=Leptinotarsa decemlineata TaxID=7539 RepID=UPI003D304F24
MGRKSKRSFGTSESESDNDYGRYRRESGRRRKKTKKHSSSRDNESREPPQEDPSVSEVRTVENSHGESVVNYTDMLRSQGEKIKHLENILADYMSKTSNVENKSLIVRADCIPEFCPRKSDLSSKKWLDKIEQLAQINGWDDRLKILNMQSRLTGLAKSWWNSLDSYDHTWMEWKQIIEAAFPDHRDFPSTLRKMSTRIKSPIETWTEYYFSKMELLRACEIQGKNAVAMIIDDITDLVIQNGAKAGRYCDPETLFSEYISSLAPEERLRCDVGETRLKKFSRSHREDHKSTFVENKHKNASSQLKRNWKCFNCNQPGHFSKSCPRPRLECKFCKRLGHLENKCPRNQAQTSKQVMKCNVPTENKSHYIMSCRINGLISQALIDTGCAVVTLRKKDAQRHGVSWEPCKVQINGYAGGVANAVGKAKVNLAVDSVETDIEVIIVPNEIQEIPMIIGQTLFNMDGVAVVVKDGAVRIFNSYTDELPQFDQSPLRKINMVVASDVEIPPNHIGLVKFTPMEDYQGEIYIEYSQRLKPPHECNLPRCITSTTSGVLPVLNASHNVLMFKSNEIVARGEPCHENVSKGI